MRGKVITEVENVMCQGEDYACHSTSYILVLYQLLSPSHLLPVMGDSAMSLGPRITRGGDRPSVDRESKSDLWVQI